MKKLHRNHLGLILIACSLALPLSAAEPPKMGEKAPDFALKTLDDKPVHLNDLTREGDVVLIVLRGWPGYQCPICTRQVQDYIASADGFAGAKARVVMVYPGPAEKLKAHAREFLTNKEWPKDFVFVTDPDYAMVNAYGVRWDAPKETSRPSTFVIDKKGMVHFARVSHTHGDRTKASDMLAELKQMPK